MDIPKPATPPEWRRVPYPDPTAARERRAAQICVSRAANDVDVLYVLFDDGTIWCCHDGDDRHWVQVLLPPVERLPAQD